jgi:hypothetical protein
MEFTPMLFQAAIQNSQFQTSFWHPAISFAPLTTPHIFYRRRGPRELPSAASFRDAAVMPKLWTYDQIDAIDPAEFDQTHDRLPMKMRSLLAGKHPAIQGSVLAERVATFIAGHTPEIRPTIMAVHTTWIERLVPDYADLIHDGIRDVRH